MEPNEPLPDEWEDFDNIHPQSQSKIQLCFESEEETWLTCYRDHIFLMPWYDCKVSGFDADGDTLQIWLDFRAFLAEKGGFPTEH